jgi:hypothetical protein
VETLKRVRKRQGRCYELAYRAMSYEPEAHKWKLVHGSILRSMRVAHAWVLLPEVDQIYDPVFNKYFGAREYTK